VPPSEDVQTHPDPAANARLGGRAIFRALLISLVLLVECVGATPAEPFDEERLQRAEGVRAVTWVGRVMALAGAGRDEAGVRAFMIDATRQLVRLRNAALDPFQPFFHYTATHQQWGLFITPKRECFRMWVEARSDAGQWQLLYSVLERDDPDLALLRYRRLRAMYNPRLKHGPSGQYPGLVSWIAQRLFDRNPEYREVRVRMERILIGQPGEPIEQLGFDHVQTRTRPAT
jgi:hypothetical protein